MSFLSFDFNKSLGKKLTSELSDKKVAMMIAPVISDAVFTRAPPYIRVCEADVVVAFAFGNRKNLSGDPNQLAEPGPMNKELAECCAQLYREKPMPMYMQWEVARFFQAGDYPDIPLSDVISIEPYWNDNRELVYLSTDGVIESIIDNHFNGNADSMGKVAVIGHRDHIKRCVMTCRARKVKSFAPKNIRLPNWYDEKSWQPWTRRRDLYVLQDMSVQLSTLAQRNIREAYPDE